MANKKDKAADEVVAEEVVAEEAPPVEETEADAAAALFPTGVDVDIADREVVEAEGEHPPPVALGDFVRLGEGENIPEHLRGHVAAVLDVPMYTDDCGWAPGPHEHQDLDKPITVRTRDAYNDTLTVMMEDVAEVGRGGRAALTNYA